MIVAEDEIIMAKLSGVPLYCVDRTSEKVGKSITIIELNDSWLTPTYIYVHDYGNHLLVAVDDMLDEVCYSEEEAENFIRTLEDRLE